ncbi:flagellar basal body rod protein FlgB [Cellulosilyticum ruminicola]|uniref:flagellar basal body rod protein FlgB n=1 Tax=Cellulosilyticum ruminicola TaxID=425254 RepID=UPI0009FA239D|nr:flagellar basal body protein [Cellulosilyticum ruminicola]
MDLFANIDLLNRALDAALVKKNVISENISNVDTPNYKRKNVSFETILQKEIKNKKSILNVDFNNIQPKFMLMKLHLVTGWIIIM